MMVHTLILGLALSQTGGPLELTAGEQKVIKVEQLQRIAIGDMAVADAKPVGTGELLVIGVDAGTTTLMVWKTDGTRVTYNVTVKRGELEFLGGATSHELERGARVFFKATGITRVMVGDPAVVEATLLEHGRLQLRTKATGRSDVVAFNGAREVGRASVEVRSPAGPGAAQSGSVEISRVEFKVGAVVSLGTRTGGLQDQGGNSTPQFPFRNWSEAEA